MVLNFTFRFLNFNSDSQILNLISSKKKKKTNLEKMKDQEKYLKV